MASRGALPHRIDPPHKKLQRVTMDREPLGVTPAELERHAAELSEHLRRKQTVLDRREAMIHSQLAALESQRRRLRARLLEEYEADECDPQGSGQSPPSDVGHDLEYWQRRQELDQRDDELQQQHRDLEQRTIELDKRQVELASRNDAMQKREEDHQQRAEIEDEQRSLQQQRLDQTERLLGEQYRQLDQERATIAQQREQFERECEVIRAEFAERQRAFEAQWEQRRRSLKAAAERNERQAAAQAQVRKELAKMHREMLELGIALQEIWGDLSQRMSLPALSQSIQNVRAQLADTYRMEREALASERERLHQLAHRLAGHKRQLDRRREELRHWAGRRSAEFEAQAAQLVARRQELDRAERRLTEERQYWWEQRRELESQFKELVIANHAA